MDNKFLNTSRRRALSQLWVSTMVGTAVLLVLQQLGKDWNAGSYIVTWRDMDWRFTLDMWMRYLLALWFAGYLTIAYLINEEQVTFKAWALFYDPVQSIGVLVALGSLGFVGQQLDTLRWGLHASYMGAFVGMVLIALPALVRYRSEWGVAGKRRVQLLRLIATIIGAVGCLLPLYPPLRVAPGNVMPWAFNAVLVLAAWVVLISYAVLRPAPADTDEDVRIKAINSAREASVKAVKDAGDAAVQAVRGEEQRAQEAIAAGKQRAVAAVQHARSNGNSSMAR